MSTISQKLITFQLNLPGYYRLAFNLGINAKIREFTNKGKDSCELCNLLFEPREVSSVDQADSHLYGSVVSTETCGLLDAEFNALLDQLN